MGMLQLLDCGMVSEQATLTPTSCWSAIIRFILASLFPVTRVIVTRHVTAGAVIQHHPTSVQRRPMCTTRGWPSTPMATAQTSRAAGLLVLVCAEFNGKMLGPVYDELWYHEGNTCSFSFAEIWDAYILEIIIKGADNRRDLFLYDRTLENKTYILNWFLAFSLGLDCPQFVHFLRWIMK